MGKNCFIHPFTALIGGGELYMLDNVSIGYHCLIATATDTWKTGKHMSSAMPKEERQVVRGKIIMERDVWIGPHVTITVSEKEPTILIGHETVIGNGAYIDKSIQPHTVIIPQQKLTFKNRKIKARYK
jgi:acetyltransferase-like isoleucine patch superfamily enzyme